MENLSPNEQANHLKSLFKTKTNALLCAKEIRKAEKRSGYSRSREVGPMEPRYVTLGGNAAPLSYWDKVIEILSKK